MSQISFRLPGPVVPKARPRVTQHGTFMPRRYQDWKAKVRDFVLLNQTGLKRGQQFTTPIAIEVAFDTTGAWVGITELDPETKRPKNVRGDIDNLVGAVMDALQDAGVIADDRLVHQITARMER